MTAELRERFDDTIGAPPVSAIDVDLTMVRMRRVVRLHRSGAAAAVVLAVVVISLGAHAALGRVAGGPVLRQPIGVPATASATQGAAVTVLSAETEKQIEERLTAVIRSLMRKAMVEAEFVGNVTDPEYPRVGAFEAWAWRPIGVPAIGPWSYLEASADIRDADGIGNVMVIVGRARPAADAVTWCDLTGTPYPLPTLETQAASGQAPLFGGCDSLIATVGDALGVSAKCPEDDPSCYEVTGPKGERAVVFPNDPGHEAGTSRGHRVEVTKPDGTAVLIQAENWGWLGATGKPSPGQRARPPLTVEQMIEIALDPRLTIVAPEPAVRPNY